jgi:hypothetical protein
MQYMVNSLISHNIDSQELIYSLIPLMGESDSEKETYEAPYLD